MSGKKVASNLAQYKNGQLTCIVCNVPVKNEIYWTGHVNGKLHRDKISLLKRKAEPQASSSTTTSSSSSAGQAKRSRLDDGKTSSSSSSKINHNSSTKLPPGTSPEDRIIFKVPQDRKLPPAIEPIGEISRSSSSNLSNINTRINTNGSSSNSRTSVESLQDEQESSQDSKQSSSNKSNKESAYSNLPEGFFDDPKLDAKARGVEYIDPEDAEWDKFVKEIASEELQSESILVVDEEESRKERELDEIEDMMGHWQRVIDLEKKKDTRVKKMETDKSDEVSSDEDDEFSEELDWRVKKLKKF